MRSLLIVPPGDAAAYAEALASGADALVVDAALAAPSARPAPRIFCACGRSTIRWRWTGSGRRRLCGLAAWR